MSCYLRRICRWSLWAIGTGTAIRALPCVDYPNSIPSKSHELTSFRWWPANRHRQTSLANAGMAVGGFFFLPLSHKIGRSSAVFWSLLGLTLCQVWSGLMTGKGDYSRFLGSRFMSGFFGTVAGVIGPRVLVDLFFLHQRGRAFTIFHYCFDFGTVAGPTLGAFVESAGSWTFLYWFTTGLSCLALIVGFLFLHETAWDREPGADHSRAPPESFVANRIATFFPGTKVAPYISFLDTVRNLRPRAASIDADKICSSKSLSDRS